MITVEADAAIVGWQKTKNDNGIPGSPSDEEARQSKNMSAKKYRTPRTSI